MHSSRFRHATTLRWPHAVALLLALTGVQLASAADERFVAKVPIKPGLTAVVAEGDFESRSIGSYSVRVYTNPQGSSPDDTTFYTAGLVRPRDGTVQSATTLAVKGSAMPLLVVIMQSAGSGGYRVADALSVSGKRVTLRAQVAGVTPDADPVAQLRRKLETQRK
jgi:hypothetical protein